MNLIVKDCFKQISIQFTTFKNQSNTSMVHHPGFKQAIFKSNLDHKAQHPSKHFPTQWNVTYLMIRSSVPLGLVFQHLEMEDDKFKFCPSALESKELAVIEQFLEP